MDHELNTTRQWSVQAKWCKLGWIVSVKQMRCEPNGFGVKWLTVLEDVVPPFEMKGTSNDIAKQVLDQIKRAL